MFKRKFLNINDNTKIKFFNKELILVFLISKVLTIALICFFFCFFDSLHNLNLWNRIYSGEHLLDACYLPFANWDGQHYLSLADLGYSNSNGSWAFFPLYPFVIKIFNLLFISPYLSAFICNLVFSYLFFYFFYNYAVRFIDKSKVLKSYILILCYPAVFFLTVLYSEALFLCLIFMFLYFYEIKKSYLSLIPAFLLPLARGQSLFILDAVVLFIIIRWSKNEKIDKKYEILNLFTFFTGGVVYLIFFYLLSGDPLSGVNAQDNFVSNFKLINTINIVRFIEYLFFPSKQFFAFNNSILDKIFIIIAFASTIIVFKSKKLSWIVFYIMLTIPVALMGYGMSFMRFFLLAVPFLSLALFNRKTINNRLLYSICIVMFFLQVYFIYRFSLNMWVG